MYFLNLCLINMQKKIPDYSMRSNIIQHYFLIKSEKYILIVGFQQMFVIFYCLSKTNMCFPLPPI